MLLNATVATRNYRFRALTCVFKVDAIDWVERIPSAENAQLRPARNGEPTGLSCPFGHRDAFASEVDVPRGIYAGSLLRPVITRAI